MQTLDNVLAFDKFDTTLMNALREVIPSRARPNTHAH